MTIEVYSVSGCERCEKAKEKLALMGLDYRCVDLSEISEHHAGWREDGSIEVMAAFAMRDNHPPMIRIGREFHDYPSAMRRLRRTTQEPKPVRQAG